MVSPAMAACSPLWGPYTVYTSQGEGMVEVLAAWVKVRAREQSCVSYGECVILTLCHVGILHDTLYMYAYMCMDV